MSSKRILLKLSGEILRQENSQDNISPEIVERVASEIVATRQATNLEIAIVVGGGNFWRGAKASARGMDRSTADYVGMIATVMNALSLQAAIEEKGQRCVVQSAIAMDNVAEPFIRRRACKLLKEGTVVIFAAGTGNPFFSTDTAAALRANEIGASILYKATKVDGVYNADPTVDSSAVKYKSISFYECLRQDLKVMDRAAFALCEENNLPIIVFDVEKEGNIYQALKGEKIGTIVKKN